MIYTNKVMNNYKKIQTNKTNIEKNHQNMKFNRFRFQIYINMHKHMSDILYNLNSH